MRKLYLKIVMAIWVVMIISSVGAIAVIRSITSAEFTRAMQPPSKEFILPAIVSMGRYLSEGLGEDGLISSFENDMLLGRMSSYALWDADGNPLLVKDPEGRFDQRVRESVSGSDEVQQFDFVHDGRDYSLSVVLPMMDGGPFFGMGGKRNMIAMLLFRPGYRWLPLVIAIPLSVFLSIIIARYLVKPLTAFERAGRRLSEGDFSVRIGPTVESRGDEIAEFAATFDQMAARIEILVRSHKDLLRDVSHELRSPLARVHAALSLARQQTRGAVDVEMDRIEHEIDRLNSLIEKLLVFARLDAKQVVLIQQPVDLGDLLIDVVSDSEIEARAEDKKISMQEGRHFDVVGDPALLASCFENIIRNAVRHSPRKSCVEIALHESGDTPGFCRVEIRDHGKGVAQHDLTEIFKPFYRADNAGSERRGGSGIGLAIAEKAVLLHGGKIFATNADDGGLIISVLLPVVGKDSNA